MNATRCLSLLLASSFVMAACRGEEGPQTQTQHTTSASSRIVDGTPEAVAVISFLNDAGTTIEVLDEDVPLPSNAAANVIAHRNGPDGSFGTGDDDLFDDVAEILAVDQIGPARLEALVAFAEAQGFQPSGDDLLGVYDGVSFTVNEAEATLVLANTATTSVLDDDIALDSRAVDSIIQARTIPSVLALSELYYVGGSALTKLKSWAGAGGLADEGDDCTSDESCAGTLRCIGIPYDGSPEIGKCANTTALPGEGDDCGHYSGVCEEGLQCAGVTVYGGEGYCRPTYMWGTFETNESVAIPDNDAAGASVDLVVYGLATVPEDIMVTLYIDHPRPQDLIVTLSSTNGSSDVLWSNDQNPDAYLPALGIERDNSINTRFTLHVVDTVSGETGTLDGFKMLVSSRWD